MKDPKLTLKAQIEATSLRKTALKLGISAPYLSDIMLGRRALGPKVLKAMGIEKVSETSVTYRKARPTA